MSMELLTVFQAIGVFAAYLLTTIALPALVLRRTIARRRLGERLLFYYLFGNLYVVTLVLFLGLMRVSNRFTLILFTVLPLYLGAAKLNNFTTTFFLRKLYANFKRLFTGMFGLRNALYRSRRWLHQLIVSFGGMMRSVFLKHILEWLLILGVAGTVIWVFGDQLLKYYGYAFSDLPVHNLWINYLTKFENGAGKPFGAGVYPFGFHCVIYYLHRVFGFDTYVVLRVFFIGQDIMIYLMLAAFLVLTCKTKYLGYVGAMAAVGFRGLEYYTLMRLDGTLPQEHGMIYILPGIYFLFQFFDERRVEQTKKNKEYELEMLRREETAAIELPDDPEGRRRDELRKLVRPDPEPTKNQKKTKHVESFHRRRWERRQTLKKKKLTFRESKASLFCLAGFSMSFSMTIAVHFYDTIIAALFCLGVGAGYVFWIFRREYFWSILTAGVLAFAVAVLPMAIALMGGERLQGSMGWALSVIQGSKDEEVDGTEGVESSETMDGSEAMTASESLGGSESLLDIDGGRQILSSEYGPESAGLDGKDKVSLKKPLKERLKNAGKTIYDCVGGLIFTSDYRDAVTLCVIAALPVLGLMGVLFWILRQDFYGSRLVSSAVYLDFLYILLSASGLGLPSLMDANRSRVYFAYSLPILFVLLLDGFCYLLRLVIRSDRFMQMFSLALSAVILTVWIGGGHVQGSILVQALQQNSAVACLAKLIRENKDFTYTIVSASDERNMGFDHAYHYELITLLRMMEYYDTYSRVTIPSEKVYFFVEKIPVAIDNPTLTGQMVNRDYAYHRISYAPGVAAYQKDERWITMSRFYYWAQELRRMYPSEVKVYYETEEFVCYELTQNPYRQFNLAIDYEFNTIDWSIVTEKSLADN